MDGWGGAPSEAEARTWLAMDLLAPVHDLWALGPGDDGQSAVEALTEGLLGEHRPELTEAALAGLLDLERALVVGAALEMASGLVESEVLVWVECALVDEACRLSLLPLVNAAADLLVELERDAEQNDAEQNDAARNDAAQNDAAEPEPAPCEPAPCEPAPCDPVLADVPTRAAGAVARGRDDTADCDDGSGECGPVPWTPGPPGASSPGGVRNGAEPLSADLAGEEGSSQCSGRVATARRGERRCAAPRDTGRNARGRPGAGRAIGRNRRGRSRGPPAGACR